MQVNREGAGCGHLCAASSAHSPNASFAPHLHPLLIVFPQEKLKKQQQQSVLYSDHFCNSRDFPP